jgi:hypothetical protein
LFESDDKSHGDFSIQTAHEKKVMWTDIELEIKVKEHE